MYLTEENISRLHRQAIRLMTRGDCYLEVSIVRRKFNLLRIAYTDIVLRGRT
jgi:hypothetical protein